MSSRNNSDAPGRPGVSSTKGGADPLSWAVGTCFGVGLLPGAPATFASALAMLVGLGAGWSGYVFVAMAALLAIPAVWAASRVASARGAADPDIVVVDEVIGQWLTLAGAATLDFSSAVVGFIIFRVLGILKPPPARQLKALPGGVGIVADDVVTGLYGAIALHWIWG